MKKTNLLLKRLAEIGVSLATYPDALALIGLGSVGAELDRLDDYSDLDFFAIVRNGTKPPFLKDLSWLTDIAPAVFHFKNTDDGFKLLYEDGVFCEFAVFTEDELKTAGFTAGRVVWKRDEVAEDIAIARVPPAPGPKRSIEWRLGECLTNLYIGLLRDQRGEKLTAMRFIQVHALDRILELAAELETSQAGHIDPYNKTRRFEQRFPQTSLNLGELMQGYDKNRESAKAQLLFLDSHFEINQALRQRILTLC